MRGRIREVWSPDCHFHRYRSRFDCLLHVQGYGPEIQSEDLHRVHGQTACKVASAAAETAAIRTATEGACADIASGVTETVSCQNTLARERELVEKALTHSGGMRIALLGTRGIPARYGGFETFAEELSTRLVERGHHVTVYCRAPYPEQIIAV